MLDRIDIHVDVPAVKVSKIVGEDDSNAESSKEIRRRVTKARKTQEERFSRKSRSAGKIVTNSEMNSREIKEFCRIEDDAKDILKQALIRLSMSARAYHKVIKTAQTIADLAEKETIQKEHVLEALQYRPKLDA